MDANIDFLEGQSRNIKKLRNELSALSDAYKTNKGYSSSQRQQATDITNKLRYGIEQYCFYLNMLQDYIQVTIPVDPFVDVLDIVGNEELSEEKQKHLLDLLHDERDGKDGVFSKYERDWFKDTYTKLDFIIENYSFLQCWESSYQQTISEDLMNPSNNANNTKSKIIKKFEQLKKNTQEENNEEFGDVTEKATAEVFEDKLKNKNKQITTSLIRSNQILKSTVLQTDLNLEEIYIQGNMLTELNDKFDVLDTLLNHSSKIMKLIEKNGSKEKRRVYLSFGFLILCISWVLWKRLIRGPLKLLLWIWFNFFKKILYTTGIASRKKIVFDQPIFEEVTSLLTTSIPQQTKTSSVTESIKSVISSSVSSIPKKVVSTSSISSLIKKASTAKVKNSTMSTPSISSIIQKASVVKVKNSIIHAPVIQKCLNRTTSKAVAKKISMTIGSAVTKKSPIIKASNSSKNLVKSAIPAFNETIKAVVNSTSS